MSFAESRDGLSAKVHMSVGMVQIKSPRAFAERASVLVAGIGFEPMTFGL